MKIFLSCCLAAAATLFAFEKNPLLAAMTDTSWLRIGDYSGRPLERQTLDYSGMVYDFHRHKILIFGGGHATAMWNQTMEFDFATLTWKQLNVPDSCPFYLDSTRGYPADAGTGWPDGGTIGYDGDKRPISRHTYDQLDMASDTCLMIMSATQCDKGGCMSQEQWNAWAYFHDTYIWLFDPVRVKWTRLSPDAIPANFATGTALDPVSGLLYMAGGRNYDIHSYDWRTRTRTVVGSCPIGWASCQAMTFLPGRRSMLLFAASNIYEYDIAAKSWSTKNPSGTHVDSYLHAVAFDSANQVFGTIKDGRFSYYSPWTNAWYGLAYNTSAFPADPTFNCMIYDPVDNVYVALKSEAGQYYGWTTWAYKFSDTPGRFPGTRGNTLMEHGVSPGQAALAISATPNPFRTAVRIQCSGNAAPDNGEVGIYDIAGKQVWRTTLRQNGAVWNAGPNGSGLYVAVYITAAGNRVSKLLFLAK